MLFRSLAILYPQVSSVSIVPVGLTKHRKGLPVLRAFDEVAARETISLVGDYAEKCLFELDAHIFFCSDELYIRAGVELPPESYYDGFPQLENGVGMLRLFEREFLEELKLAFPGQKLPFSVATGVSAAPFIEKLLVTAAEKCVNMSFNVYPIRNDFLGHSIDVVGLITGFDLIEQLRGRKLGAALFIPQTMLRHGEGVFLDDVTVADVEKELGVPVISTAQDGAEFLRAIESLQVK